METLKGRRREEAESAKPEHRSPAGGQDVESNWLLRPGGDSGHPVRRGPRAESPEKAPSSKFQWRRAVLVNTSVGLDFKTSF